MARLKIMIVGGGRHLFFLSRSLLAKGHTVTVVNEDKTECEWLARRLNILVVHGDGSLPRLLGEAGISEMDMLLAATSRDEDNLAICQSAAHQFNVPRTMALVNDPELEPVFRSLGVEGAFSVTHVLTTLIERRVETDAVLNLLPLGEGEVNLTEVVLSERSPVAGKPLHGVKLPENALVACVFRSGKTLIPRGNTVLLAGDRLVVLTMADDYARVLRLLTGEE